MTDLTQLIIDPLASASAGEILSAAAVVLIVSAVCWESVARRDLDAHAIRRLGVASVLGVGGLLVSAVLGGLMSLSFLQWGRLAPRVLVEFWIAHPWVGAAAAFVAFDAVGHLHHWVGHHTRLGHAAHAPHHSDPVFAASLAFRQSWFPIHGLVIFPMVAVGGWSIGTVVACAALSNVIQALQHFESAPTMPSWIRAVVITPDEHRLHHQVDPLVNLGPVFTLWDRLGRTYRVGASAEPTRTPTAEPPVSVLASQFGGWRVLADRGFVR